LYTISGGIRIAGDLPAHSRTNLAFIASGGLLASLIGTTGAAMLLVRPLLETNAERKHVKHTVVFFIFVVCNCGGLLLPLGDPPLFLGYLNGVGFLWTLSLWKNWLFINGMLLTTYVLLDHFYFYPRERKEDLALDEAQVRKLTFSGIWPNGLLLFGIILSVAFLDPSKPVPGTSWHPWIYLREMVQLALVAVSLLMGPHTAREANGFDYLAIIEVGVLFIGIFVAMQPALEILHARGDSLGINSSHKFFWASGCLSSVLDNAPTYLVFFNAAEALSADVSRTVAGVAEDFLSGIALGSVTMGAMTYIGNGPNFMVKTIAERSGVKMPSFFGYMVYSFLILLPILAVDTWLFLE
jgi:Na+/H+ antiporter NhaD/arsenite permease-like protein